MVSPLGETRPGWKVLRVLGNLLGLAGFDADSSEQVRDAVLGAGQEAHLCRSIPVDLSTLGVIEPSALPAGQLERVAHVMPHGMEAITRRATSMQQTFEARDPGARIHPDTLAALGLADGAAVRVDQGDGVARVTASADPTVARGTVWLPAAHASTAGLASMFGAVAVRQA